jgi:hypothetical protein
MVNTISYPPIILFDLICTLSFLSRIGDDAHSFQITMHNGYARLPSRLPKTPGSKTYTQPKPSQQQDLYGPQTVRMSTWQAMQWNSITQAGFLNYHGTARHGLCTWIYVHVGVMIVAIMEPKYDDSHRTRREVNDRLREMQLATISVREYAHVATTFLLPGKLL